MFDCTALNNTYVIIYDKMLVMNWDRFYVATADSKMERQYLEDLF
jgi:hypothetical protein